MTRRDRERTDEALRALGRATIEPLAGTRAPTPRAVPRIGKVIAWMTGAVVLSLVVEGVGDGLWRSACNAARGAASWE